MNKNWIVFADSSVGLAAVQHILEEHRECLCAVCVTGEESIVFKYLMDVKYDRDRVLFEKEIAKESGIAKLKDFDADCILLAWWPSIVKKDLIDVPRTGVLNFHPSLLPYNKGKHYNFWAIVEECPFGVTIHFVDESIDGGDIVFQQEIETTWLDTGKTLYKRAQREMVTLFKKSFRKLVSGDYERIPQTAGKGSFHYGRELDLASRIELDKKYTAKDLINRLRARTFEPHPACFFSDANEEYEIRVNIRKKKSYE